MRGSTNDATSTGSALGRENPLTARVAHLNVGSIAAEGARIARNGSGRLGNAGFNDPVGLGGVDNPVGFSNGIGHWSSDGDGHEGREEKGFELHDEE